LLPPEEVVVRALKTSLIVAVAVLLAACRGHRESVTGSYGDAVLSGQIVMASGMANASPAGVRVAVGGTGMSAVVGADGRFAFAGVKDGAELLFQRQSDGVSARMTVASTSAPVVVELGLTTATMSRHRASPSTPAQQFEGTITASSATSLTVHDSHGNDVVVALTDKTVIRKGGQMLTPADLTVGLRVHVAAIDVDTVKTALLVIVQDEKAEPGDDHGGETMTANGTIKSVGADSLVVTTVPKGDVTVQVDANTLIRKQGHAIQLSDVKVGDGVAAEGQRVDDHTMLAQKIEVSGKGGGGGGHH